MLRAFLLAISALAVGAAPAFAYPLLAPHPVASAIAGPTDPSVAAIFYNPGALAPLRGFHLWIDGGTRLDEGSIQRADGRGSASINWGNLDAFSGLTWDLDTDSVTIGLATYTPFTEFSSYPLGSPVAYHERWQNFATFEQTAAAAVKIGNRVFVGASANFAESWIDYKFERDTALAGGSAGVNQPGGLCGAMPCGLENPLAAQALRLRGFGWGIGFSVGLLTRPVDRLWIGIAYTSHIFNTGNGVDMPLRTEYGAEVRAAPGQGTPCPTLGRNQDTCNGNDQVTLWLPDILHAGVRIDLTPAIDLESTVRWVHYGGRSQLDVAMQGGNLYRLGTPAAAALPADFWLDFGLVDTLAAEGSVRFKIGDRLRLAPSITVESSAIESSAVNAAALDGPKIDATLQAEWRPLRHLRLGAHAGGTAYFLGDVSSRFDPNAQVACVDASYSLDACRAYNNGYALPSASGHYTLFVISLGAALGIDY